MLEDSPCNRQGTHRDELASFWQSTGYQDGAVTEVATAETNRSHMGGDLREIALHPCQWRFAVSHPVQSCESIEAYPSSTMNLGWYLSRSPLSMGPLESPTFIRKRTLEP